MGYSNQCGLLEQKLNLQDYLSLFRDLKVNHSSGHAKPHKACLLLAVIDLMDEKYITENRIKFDQRLRDAFSLRFARYKQGNDKDNPVNPFFFLSSSGFWHLHANSGKQDALRERLESRAPGGVTTINRLVSHASLTTSLYSYFENGTSRTLLAGALEGTLMTPSEAFSRWCHSIGKSKKTISNYLKALSGPVSAWASEQQGKAIEIISSTNPSDILEVRESLAHYSVFQKRDSSGKGIYSAALKLWERYLHECRMNDSIEQDIREIQNRQVDSTIRETLVKARRGQGFFRDRVLSLWDERCAATGYANTRFLVASHIKPWKFSDDSERLDQFNGLPLIPSIDKAFDLGFISFDSTGRVMLSTELEEPEKLGIREELKVGVSQKHQHYLDFHRSEVFDR